MRKHFFTLFLICFGFSALAQRSFLRRGEYKDSCHHIMIFGVHIAGEIPYGDMPSRFGGNFSAGMPILYKTSKNLIVGVEGNYIFGGNVRENPLAYMYTSANTITNGSGNPGQLRLNERGFTAYAVIGQIIPKTGKNKNSGVLAYLGIGYMQHKINIYDVGKSLPQIYGALSKGYDRLTGGPAAMQFIGYMYLAKNRLANCYAGFEIQEGFTTGLRGYQYDTMTPDNKKRLDILIGFRLGWMLPLYKKAPKEFYYN
ncbi:MAG TPA: hypothetical protein VK835_02000 [Bacteroidia bacterium]|jgi:hypothetical protein|nr:hypothetical protein [Bacteroidia bacterium]